MARLEPVAIRRSATSLSADFSHEFEYVSRAKNSTWASAMFSVIGFLQSVVVEGGLDVSGDQPTIY